MNLSERVLQRFKSGANRALSDEDYAKAADLAYRTLGHTYGQLDPIMESLLDMGLSLKDRGQFQDASTLMELTEATRGNINALAVLVKRLHRLPPAKQKPAKPGPKPNPWTKPL